ncbi:hypothetical protein D3C80_1612760 [compost metagenome]
MVSWIGLPVSSVSSKESASLRSRMISAARFNIRPRAMGLIAAHSFWARLADAMARSTIAGVAACSLAMTSPVAGKTLSKSVPALSST